MKLLLVLQYVPLLFMSQKGNTLYFCKMFLYLQFIYAPPPPKKKWHWLLCLLRRNFKNFNTRGGLKGFWVFVFLSNFDNIPWMCFFNESCPHWKQKSVVATKNFGISENHRKNLTFWKPNRVIIYKQHTLYYKMIHLKPIKMSSFQLVTFATTVTMDQKSMIRKFGLK